MMHFAGRSGSSRVMAVAMCAVAVASVRAYPQQDTLRAFPTRDSVRYIIRRTPNGFEAQVERMAREVALRRKVQIDLSRTLEALSRQFQQASAAERGTAEQHLKQVRLQLTTVAREGAEMSRKLRSLCNEERRPDGWLGVAIEGDMEWQRGDDGQVTRRYLGYLTIASVEPASPAERGGVKAGDVLLAMGGEDVRGEDFDMSAMLKPGNRLVLKVRRGMEARSLNVTIATRPESFSTPCPWVDDLIASALATPPNEPDVLVLPSAPSRARQAPVLARAPTPARIATTDAPSPSDPAPPLLFTWGGASSVAGAQLAPVNPELGENFGVDRGLLIISVGRGTPAEASGLRSGDVILSADGVVLTDPTLLQRIMNRSRERGEVPLVIVRKKQQQVLNLKW